MNITTSGLQNKAKEAFEFTLNAASTGTSIVRGALERVAETVSSQIGDNLNLFVFENRSDQAFVGSLAWGVSCAVLQPTPLPTVLGTLLLNGFISTSKKDVIDEIKSMDAHACNELREEMHPKEEQVSLSDHELKSTYPDRLEELKADRIMNCLHQKMSTEVAHINVFATALLTLIGNLEFSVLSPDAGSNLLYGVLGTTLSVNAYHFVCRQS